MVKKRRHHFAPAEGERAAISGYRNQHKLSAEIILRALRHDTLEWIRVADPKAGRVDDCQYGSPGSVDVYQVKWSRESGNFPYSALTKSSSDKPSLIRELADGWMRLRKNHPRHRVFVHLLTNKMPSVTKLIPLV